MLVLLGLLAGLCLGLTGGGGAIIIVPLLVYVLHTPMQQAITTSLVIVCLTSLAGVLPKWRWHYLEKRTALLVATSGILMAPLGAHTSAAVPSYKLLNEFSCLMLFAGSLLIYRSFVFNAAVGKDIVLKTTNNKKNDSTLLIAGTITGFLTGFFGVGGGFLMVPALILWLELPVKKAMATSLLISFLISISALISHLSQSAIHWHEVALTLAGSLIGVNIGAYFAKWIPGPYLQRGFAIFILSIGSLILWQNFYH